MGAKGNNLKNVTASIPLGTLTCVTGVSGGGKSTLTIETLVQGGLAQAQPGPRASRAARPHRGAGISRQGHRHRPEPDRAHAALQPPRPIPAPSRRSATGSPNFPRRRPAAISRGASRST
ncbi:MAG: hypothetical protein WDM81_18845 [Rhizomicrobium sp.]